MPKAIFLFLLSLAFAPGAHARCLKGTEATRIGNMLLEYAPGSLRPVKRYSRARFLFINPRLTGDQCYKPLSLEEKLDQQGGRKFADELAPQLVGYRNWKWARKLERSRLRDWLGEEPVGHYLEMIKHPWISLHVDQLYDVKARAGNIEAANFGVPRGEDEGDAVRHFIGSFLLTLKYGEKFAFKATNVHEKDFVTMASMMDRFNNSVARAAALPYRSRGETLSDEQILTLAVDALREKRIVYLRSTHGGQPNRTRAFEAWSYKLLRARLY
ncbi:MAG: hypothetical protein ABL958_14815 [Bdellovibrionia bacterium]